ncbi:inner membrane protein [Micromonospora pisi]|uniref:Inner membrane protein n=1 Tax=Micromonospora pisi TaxID=589240 RepID=A0A495JE82_9ACTN|nr:YgjV family protein [Micromonospora pisi]RKR87041.1 inner membrane protein [Micromonospora pisi]
MNWLDIIGWSGSALLVWSLLQTRVLRLRALNLVGSLVLIGYNAALGVWPGVGLNVVIAIINVWYLRRMLATRHDERTYEVVEVGTGDGFLNHTLRVHAADIARFNPEFRWGGADPDRSAFLVVRADEVVGVVLVNGAGGDVARVELDYVTQRFRDFTPGEFVYRRSSLFTNRGYRRVLTPPGMVAPYYDRLGFRREGDSYVLDLPPVSPGAGAGVRPSD